VNAYNYCFCTGAPDARQCGKFVVTYRLVSSNTVTCNSGGSVMRLTNLLNYILVFIVQTTCKRECTPCIAHRS